MARPQVLEAAVIGVPHPILQERPVAYVVPKPEFVGQVTADDILDFLRPQVAKWWLPDEVLFIEAVPKTSVGKLNKPDLPNDYAAAKSLPPAETQTVSHPPHAPPPHS